MWTASLFTHRIRELCRLISLTNLLGNPLREDFVHRFLSEADLDRHRSSFVQFLMQYHHFCVAMILL